ncbi:hypothetical protein [Arcanobacterium hippocoleae]|uniref:hypothetical protein n=1 Tax=Arcanobacterium hippocoleae TaxID=149017 RepID=UPI0033416599
MPRTMHELLVGLLTFALVVCLFSLLALVIFPLRTVLSIAFPSLLLGVTVLGIGYFRQKKELTNNVISKQLIYD